MLSIIVVEAHNPCKVIPKTSKTVYICMTVFFIGSTIVIGTLVLYVNEVLYDAIQKKVCLVARVWRRCMY